MLHQLIKLDRDTPFILACSGGVDSMAIADFYKRGGKRFTVAYFHHGTPQADAMENIVLDWAVTNSVHCSLGSLKKQKPIDLSPEEHWRNERYAWLCSYNQPVVTCHHLNDVAETWLFGAMHGRSKLIAYERDLNGVTLYRPFLTNTKQQLIDWCIKHNVKWFEDASNADVTSPRNRIRHNILPEALKINPGLLKVLKKKIWNGSEEWEELE